MQPLVAAERRDVPPAPVGCEATNVFIREQREQRVGRSFGWWPYGVADRGPMGAVVGGDLEPVGGGDHRGIPPDRDATRGYILPLRAELLEGPVPPGRAAI